MEKEAGVEKKTGMEAETNKTDGVNAGTDFLTTVIIPNYNGMAYMENCLQSLLSGSRRPPVIIVDNGSTDGSREWLLKEYENREGITLILLPENTGFDHAVNVGIQAAETEFVFLLNNDTVVDVHCVEELEKVMTASERTFSVGARMLNLHDPEKLDDAGDCYSALGWAFARGKDQPAERYLREERIFAACAGAALYRRSLLEKLGGFDEAHFAYLEDLDVGYRANLFGYRNLFAPKAVVLHAGSGVTGSRHNAFKVEYSARNNCYLISKNMPLLQILLNLPFLLTGFLIKALFFAGKGLGGCYLKGTGKGIALSLSVQGRQKKIPFSFSRWKNYAWIQWELWKGMFLRFF